LIKIRQTGGGKITFTEFRSNFRLLEERMALVERIRRSYSYVPKGICASFNPNLNAFLGTLRTLRSIKTSRYSRSRSIGNEKVYSAQTVLGGV
jgi:hypothetical protein